MKLFSRIFACAFPLAVLAGMACSCEADTPAVTPPAEEGKEEVQNLPGIDDALSPSVISAVIPDAVTTRVSLSDGWGTGLSLAWQAGDCLRIAGASGPGVPSSATGTLFSIVEEGMLPSRAGFRGSPVAGDSFTVIYPGTYESEDAVVSRSYLPQVQDGNGSTAHLEWNAVLSGLDSYASLSFSDAGEADYRCNGVVKFRLSVPERFASVEKISLTAPSPVFFTTNSPEGPKSSELSLELRNIDLSGESRTLDAYMMVSWNDAVLAPGSAYSIGLYGPGGQFESFECTVPEGGLVIGGGHVCVLGLDSEDLQEPLFWAGDGASEATAYEIKTVKHLQNMNELIASNAGASKLFFKLVDDIDMAGVAWAYKNSSISNEWPINFNGDGHTISNFSVSGASASLFGALKGEVYDVTFRDAAISTAGSSARGGLLAFRAGSAESPVTISRVKVEGLKISGSGGYNSTPYAVGGLVGLLTNATVEDCRISGLDMDASTSGAGGGIAGLTYGTASTITGCHVEGTITGPEENVGTNVGIGGIVGYDAVGGNTFSSNTAAVTITTYAKAGGIIGNGKNGVNEITACISSGSITASATESYIGGIAGYYSGTISKCHSACAISGGRRCGGIGGYAEGSVSISECWFDGSISCNNYGSGGIIGSSATETVLSVQDCYSKGILSHGGTSGFVGGIAGFLAGASFTMRDCYSTMSISTSIAAAKAPAGLVGGHNNTTAEWNVEGCLAWNEKLDFGAQTSNDNGVIVGQFHSKASTAATSAKNCWYRHGLDYSTGISGRSLRNDTDITSGGNKSYDGKDAGEGVSCSAKASELGWNTDLWDLSGEYPILKNNKEL